MTTTVLANHDHYTVSDGNKSWSVGRDYKCSCGNDNSSKQKCAHYHAVYKYLKNGGRRAGENDEQIVTQELFTNDHFVIPACHQADPPSRLEEYRQLYQKRADTIIAKRRTALEGNGDDLAHYWHEINHLSDRQASRQAFMDKWGMKYKFVKGDIQSNLL